MIKRLLFSFIFLNLSSSLFCMTGMMQRMRMALPSAICVARIPKPHLMPQRNLIYSMYGLTSASIFKEPAAISKLVNKSSEVSGFPVIVKTRPGYPPNHYFAQIGSNYFLVENDNDVAALAASKKDSKCPFKIAGEAEVLISSYGLTAITKEVYKKNRYRSFSPQSPIRWFYFTEEKTNKTTNDEDIIMVSRNK